ncbi:class I SAM-dependent methyltransferase [Microvirga pudoricolor]|uniref:class I SAM-dependent methyltransferase n=1 Tax=Microvirga pudoricolor TaxID=2778729 RepID=UPI00194F46B5|nr:class I SAM-dependent methyltransferase [Microvirga pudoricolor]MBM6596280.1 class I SAM-dependent methyltransferase [Microvirga pudoricolor]
MRVHWRRLAFGLSTLLGPKARGFFIPYRYAQGIDAGRGYPALRPIFEAAGPSFEAVLAEIRRHEEALRTISERGPARFDQDWFPGLDAAAAYAIVRRERPRRIVEIGSGHSTRFMAQAVADGGLATDFTCIDPAPRATLARLRVRHIPALLQEADPGLFAGLEAGDVLFIDSSHIAMPGTDVDRLFLDVLPRLAPGTLVHIHDITLPDAYPKDWAWRGYNEQSLAGALIQGGGYEVVFASHYVAATLGANGRLDLPAVIEPPSGAYETSLWLRKRHA